MKKICIITNSKLTSFFKAYTYLNSSRYKFLIISTSKIKYQSNKNIKNIYISDADKILFNQKIIKECKKENIKKILLFYTKKIDKNIFKNFKTINIHNSLLPNYKGLNAINKTLKDKNKIFCSSAHIVNEEFDSGKILYQVATPIIVLSKSNLKNIAFYHRVILILTILENNNNNLSAKIIGKFTLLCPGIDKNLFKKIKRINNFL
jgi:hypothetical protein